MIDLDNFKLVNDLWGHSVGDDLLRQFAKELQLNSRSADLVGRWGGMSSFLCSPVRDSTLSRELNEFRIGRSAGTKPRSALARPSTSN